MYRRTAGFCNSQRDNPYYDCPVDPQRFTAARLLSSLCRSSLAYALHLVIGHFVMVAVILSDMLDQPVEDLHPSQIGASAVTLSPALSAASASERSVSTWASSARIRGASRSPRNFSTLATAVSTAP